MLARSIHSSTSTGLFSQRRRARAEAKASAEAFLEGVENPRIEVHGFGTGSSHTWAVR